MAICLIEKYINYCYSNVLCDHFQNITRVNCHFHQVPNTNRFTASSVHSIVSFEIYNINGDRLPFWVKTLILQNSGLFRNYTRFSREITPHKVHCPFHTEDNFLIIMIISPFNDHVPMRCL